MLNFLFLLIPMVIPIGGCKNQQDIPFHYHSQHKESEKLHRENERYYRMSINSKKSPPVFFSGRRRR